MATGQQHEAESTDSAKKNHLEELVADAMRQPGVVEAYQVYAAFEAVRQAALEPMAVYERAASSHWFSENSSSSG